MVQRSREELSASIKTPPAKLTSRTHRSSLTSSPTSKPISARNSVASTPTSPPATRTRASLGNPASSSLLKPALKTASKQSSTDSNHVRWSASAQVIANGNSKSSAGSAANGNTMSKERKAELISRIGYEPRTNISLPPNDKRTTQAIVWLDIDNTLYKRSTKIAELMADRIRNYFYGMGLGQDEAKILHQRYYKSYGLAIRGLVKHHQIDPLDYDEKCDASLPLEEILRPDKEVKKMLSELDRTKVKVFALTNAYKYHANRCLRLLDLQDQIEGIVYCDYAVPDFACKPELDYYRAALLVVGATDDMKHYFVDDSSLNIVAAKELGWHSCIYFRETDDDEAPSLASKDAKDPYSFQATSLVPAKGTCGFDEDAIRKQLQNLPDHQRLRLLGIMLDACFPGDLRSMSTILEKHIWSTRDIISGLPDSATLAIFDKLPVQDLLRCRQVSKKWLSLAATPELWRSHALALTKDDPVKINPPSVPEQWESLVKGLFFRERNWEHGLAQSVQLLEGHTGFVTSMKLNGGKTLVSGSYDETIRVWDISTGLCNKVLKAKAISCLDFLEDEGVLCAGLYDTGRVLIWDMKTWDLIQTLSGHNKGIRNVAINKDHLVSVGQDKAIVVWDWRTGNKVVRFGQQSSVSLGVSLVDSDKLVAVTVDGMIRCFSIPRREMIGQFQLTKLGGPDVSLASRLGDVASGTSMLEWFAAHGNTMTVASKNVVVHLEWQEQGLPTKTDPVPSNVDGLDQFAALRLTNTTTTTLNPLRPRHDSTQSTAGTVDPVRARRDSSASMASTSSAVGAAKSPRRSLVSSASTSPTASLRNNRSSVGGMDPSTSMLSTPSRPRPSPGAKKPSGPAPWPLAVDEPPTTKTSSSTPSAPTKSARPAPVPFPSPAPTLETGDSSGFSGTRFAPNLSIAPRVVSVLETPDMATGSVDPVKRRIVSATRFSTRAGAERQLYTSSLPLDLGKTSAELAHKSSRPAQRSSPTVTSVSPIQGAWAARADELSVPTRNPMAMVLDHESVVVGCADGCIYRIHFVGSQYELKKEEVKEFLPTQSPDTDSVGDRTITDLLQLRDVWSDLFVPPNAPHHPGRLNVGPN